MNKKGIDISKWQGSVNFLKVKQAGIQFIILREGYKEAIDECFLEYVKGCKENNIKVPGVYHFLYCTNEVEARAEARSCIQNVRKAGLEPSIVIFADFEYDTVKKAASRGIKLGKEACIACTEAFLDEISKAGYKTGIYANIDYYKNMYTPEIINKHIFWLADYTDEPDYACTFIQTGSKGIINGISGYVDTDIQLQEIQKGSETDNTITVEKPQGGKSVDIIAKEVIAGKWGTGDARKNALEAASYDYKVVQAKVNEILNGSAVKPSVAAIPEQPTSKKVTAIAYAEKKDSKIAGSYITTANLYLRNDAGTNKKALVLIPKGYTINCYGYYSIFNGAKWYYIQAAIDGILYTGFSHSGYLKRK